MSTNPPIFCTNHPKAETLLRCNKCGRPFCIRCLERMPVGYRCKECLNVQQAGFYNATSADYVVAALVGIVVSIVGGVFAAVISGFWLFAIFYAPFAGGIIAEVIRRATQKRRGRYLWLVACATVVLGAFIGASAFPLFALLVSGRLDVLFFNLPRLAVSTLFNLGFAIYLALAVSTVYARLR